MIPRDLFPRLTAENYRITSPADTAYNCIAWAAHDTEKWWQPGSYWPVPLPADESGLGALEQAFLALGFEPCAGDSLEPGYEKIALYGSSAFLYTHAARQLPNGKWTSKLGKAEDIEHDTPNDVAGGLYGELVEVMRRPLPAATGG